jgi:hypothetical protein
MTDRPPVARLDDTTVAVVLCECGGRFLLHDFSLPSRCDGCGAAMSTRNVVWTANGQRLLREAAALLKRNRLPLVRDGEPLL